MSSTRHGNWPGVSLAVTVVCGLAGGLLACLFLDVDEWVLLILFVGTVVGSAVAFWLLTTDQHVGPAPAPPPEPGWQGWQAGSTRPGSVPNRSGPVQHNVDLSAEARMDAPGHVVQPLRGTSAAPPVPDNRQWWVKTAPNSGSQPASPSGPAPSLSSYQAQRALIAQCPRCGDFHLDVSRAGKDYSFRCRNPRCGNAWTWTPGSAWPAVVVRRNLTGGSSERTR